MQRNAVGLPIAGELQVVRVVPRGRCTWPASAADVSSNALFSPHTLAAPLVSHLGQP